MPLTHTAQPTLRRPILVGAFEGLPDAGMAASLAIRHLVAAFDASELAIQDSDDYYDYSELRPISRLTGSQDRVLEWPHGEFWYAHHPEADETTHDLIFYIVPEPQLRWRAFAAELAEACVEWEVGAAILLASVPADVPHTRSTVLTGWATAPELRVALNQLGDSVLAVRGAVQRPLGGQRVAAGIHQVPSASLFGSVPHYLQVPNPAVSAALLEHAARLVGWSFDLDQLRQAARQLLDQADEAVAERPELAAYLQQLEDQYDESKAPLAPGRTEPSEQEESSGPLAVDPEELVEELEDFLRRRREEGDPDSEEDQPPRSSL